MLSKFIFEGKADDLQNVPQTEEKSTEKVDWLNKWIIREIFYMNQIIEI